MSDDTLECMPTIIRHVARSTSHPAGGNDRMIERHHQGVMEIPRNVSKNRASCVAQHRLRPTCRHLSRQGCCDLVGTDDTRTDDIVTGPRVTTWTCTEANGGLPVDSPACASIVS